MRVIYCDISLWCVTSIAAVGFCSPKGFTRATVLTILSSSQRGATDGGCMKVSVNKGCRCVCMHMCLCKCRWGEYYNLFA